MGKQYVLFFNEVTKESIDLVGGKGANLGELVKAGFPVPKGYCISVDAYKSIVESDIQEKINKIIAAVDWNKPSDIEERALQIRELIMNIPIPDEIKKEIVCAYYHLSQAEQPNGAAVAVRSSATAEDLPDASFAGQQETYLNIRGEHELLINVKCCWASLWTARAMAYRHKQNYDHSKVYLSIVIQRMVEAEAAGVAFTANPLNGREDEILINSSYGLGEVVVAGIVTPDNFILDRKTLGIKTRLLGSKEKRLEMDPTGRTQQVDVPIDQRNKFSLSDAQIRELGELAIRVEEHYQVPQDIEWAFAKGKVYLLQARPVTALGPEVNQDDTLTIDKLTKIQKFMLDDLIEHYPEAPTPLDHAVVTTSYQAILNSADNLGIKISRAKEIICLENDGRITLVPPKSKYSSGLLSVPAKLFKATKISQAHWQKEYQQISQAIYQLEETNIAAQKDEQLAIYLKEVFHLAERICYLRFYNFFEANLLPLAVISLVLKVFCSKNNRPQLMDLITTGLDYKTAIIDREINGLAVAASLEPQVHAIIMDGEAVKFENIKKQLLHIDGGQEFLGKFEDFLKVYGYRTEKMYQPFTSRSWLENPDQLMVIIRAALQDPQLTERKNNELKRKKEHETWVNNFENKLKGPFKRLFRWGYDSLRTNHMIREETLFTLEKVFTIGRKIKNEHGNRLTHAGYLKAAEDIVYLTKEEITHGIIGQIEKDKCQQLVNTRKKHFSLNQALWKKTLLKLVEHKKDVDTLQGISGSPGFVEGPAQIIMNVHDYSKLKKGDILVCPYTDPTWTPLFGMVAAVVADTGGPLSHAAIVAREYGIPAVLGTKVGTSYINVGEIVVVDGSAGIVYKKGTTVPGP